jgi:hypothetical protein
VVRRLRTSSKNRMRYRLKNLRLNIEDYEQVKNSYLGHLSHGTCDILAQQICIIKKKE